MNHQSRESDHPSSTLRIVLLSESIDNLTIEISLLNDQASIACCSVRIPARAVSIDTSEQDELRWYFEDFLMYPAHPAPKVAARIEKQIAEHGVRLFNWLFGRKAKAHTLWKRISHRIGEIRVEAIWESKFWPLVPLEFIRPAEDQPPLAVSAESFVHSVKKPDSFSAEVNRLDPLRILLVISRPFGLSDIPFRSIGIPLLRSLSNRRDFSVETLRPPTISNLIARLNETKEQGQPFNIVHFDGHGIYGDLNARATGQEPKNMRGYLVFENPATANNQELITGKQLGEYLRQAGVSYLILNACRSAHANSPAPAWVQARADQAYPSLAQEVLSAGIAGVVGMRYAVYVSTAVRFIDHLYTSLSQGSTLGEAVQLGRRQLLVSAAESQGPVVRRIQDWCVPVIYESAALLLDRKRGNDALRLVESTSEWIIDENLKASPTSGVVGRDEAVMAMEQALASSHVVLLQGMAGSGKTVVAADFCRWYAFTSATAGVAVLTSLDQPKTLAQIFEQVESFISTKFVASVPEPNREETVGSRLLRFLNEIPVLWIWDGIETLSGLSLHAPNPFSAEDQMDLKKFLLAAKNSKAKFLLTSRRDESSWLGDGPIVSLSAMTTADSLTLCQALAARWNTQITDIDTWWPLLQLVRGNPLVTILFFTQAFHEQLQLLDQVELFVQRINQGTVQFSNEECAALAETLSTSLGRGFDKSFSEEEQRYIALFHVWSHMNASLLAAQGNPAIKHPLEWLSSFGIQDWTSLLDRLAHLGLVEPYNAGNYVPHPALQWFLKGLFDRFYSGQEFVIYRAYVETLSLAVTHWLRSYRPGDSTLVNALYTTNVDLIRGLEFARMYALEDCVLSLMSGLYEYYDMKGYTEDWARVLDRIVRDCTDPETGFPLSGHETLWLNVTQHRITIAIRERRFDESAQLSKLILDWVQGNEALNTDKENLASALHELGRVLLEQQNAGCVAHFEQALRLAREIGHVPGAARCIYNLANAYRSILEIKDLKKAETLARESLSLRAKTDYQAQAKSLSLLGTIIYQAFVESERADQESKPPHVEVVSLREFPKELPKGLQEAQGYLKKALKILPPDDVRNRADISSQLANLFAEIGDVDSSLFHRREAIKEYEAAQRPFEGAKMRLRMAEIFLKTGKLMDAFEYAKAALEMLAPFGDQANELTAVAQSLIKSVVLNLSIRDELPKTKKEGSISDYVTFINLDE